MSSFTEIVNSASLQALELTGTNSPVPDYHFKMAIFLGAIYLFYLSHRLKKIWISTSENTSKVSLIELYCLHFHGKQYYDVHHFASIFPKGFSEGVHVKSSWKEKFSFVFPTI